MKTALKAFVLLVISAAFPGIGISRQPDIVTVCDVLANPNEYGNSVVAVIGRLDVTGIIFDRRSFISQDQCEEPLKTNGYIWPNKILLWTEREKGLPNPPGDRPQLDHRTLAEKISLMSKDTTLGVRKEFRMNKEGNPIDIVVKNQWVVAYGHTLYSPQLTTAETCKEFGCRGFNGEAPVVIVVDPQNVHTLNEDGTFSIPEKPAR